MPAIVFRRLGVEDLQQVFLWLARPHVSKGYAPAPSSFMEVVAKYGPRAEEDNAVQAFIVAVDATDVGYIQTYAIDAFPDYARSVDCGKGVACMDLFIGEESFMHRGIGAEVVRRFVDDVVFAREGVHACLAGPTEGNHASIRAFEKAGFRRWKIVKMEGAEPECVLRRERDT